jgi:hypothetical protein
VKCLGQPGIPRHIINSLDDPELAEWPCLLNRGQFALFASLRTRDSGEPPNCSKTRTPQDVD